MPENTLNVVHDPCVVLTVTKATSSSGATPRCVACHQREGNPGDCTEGDRFSISFGAAGGVVLCEKALLDLEEKIANRAVLAEVGL